MIALGGAIGTGLFLASGESVAIAGPGGAMVAYTLIGIMVYFLMTSLGEMTAYLPVTGTFASYCTRYVHRSFGFAVGWNYWFNWAIVIASEVAASSQLMKFWFPDTPGIIFSAIFLVLLLALNAVNVRAYGESEFWFAGIKVVVIVIFLIAGFWLILSNPNSAMNNWTFGDAPFHGGFGSIVAIFMIAGYSFQGAELFGQAAAESKDPEKMVPKSIRQTFWRILLFYIMAMFVIGSLLAYTDPNLGIEDVAVSPFTLVFTKLGVPYAAGILNAVLLTAVLSAGNSAVYACTRMLYDLAMVKSAPALFACLGRSGVPYYALFASCAFGLLTFLSSIFGDGEIFLWLLNLVGLTGFISWAAIALSHYRFRRGFIAQGNSLDALTYKAPFYPIGPLLALFACIFIIFGQNYQAFFASDVDWNSIIATYIGLPVFAIIFFMHKMINKTKTIPYAHIDLSRDAV